MCSAEKELSHESSGAAVEAVAGLHEAADDPGGIEAAAAAGSRAAVARGAAEVGWALMWRHQRLDQRQRVMLMTSVSCAIGACSMYRSLVMLVPVHCHVLQLCGGAAAAM